MTSSSTPARPTPSFEIEQSCPPRRPWQRTDIRVDLSVAHCMPMTEQLAARIEVAWRGKKARSPNARLFNGLKFRLAGSSVDGDGKLVLSLGVTSYVEHTGTNVLPVGDDDDRNGAAASASSSALAHALGVEAVLLAADGPAVLFQRSTTCADFHLYFACPGGHAEPFRVFAAGGCRPVAAVAAGGAAAVDPTAERLDESIPVAALHEMMLVWIEQLRANCAAQGQAEDEQQAETTTTTATAPRRTVSDLVCDELFHSIEDEICDEIGVPRDTLTNHGVVGVMRASSAADRGKPDLLFVVGCSLTVAQIQEGFAHAADAFESEGHQLLAVPLSSREALGRFFDSTPVVPPSAAALQLTLERWM